MMPYCRQLLRSKRLLCAALGLVLYLVAGFLLVPALLKWQLLKQLPRRTHRQASVRQVLCNPLTLSLTVRGLKLVETNGQPFAALEELYANFQLSSLVRLAWTFDEINLVGPQADIVLDRDGRFNFANLLEATPNPPSPKPAKGTPRLLVFSLAITNGRVAFADLSRQTPFRTEYTPINFHLSRFTTQPGLQSPYSFHASSDSGGSVAWDGSVTAQPLSSSGTVRLRGLKLPRHGPYLEGLTRAQLADGMLDLAVDYQLAVGTNGFDLVASDFGLQITGLKFKDSKAGEDVLTLPRLDLHNGAFDWRARRIRVGTLSVNAPSVLVRRRADGSINLPSLLSMEKSEGGAQAAKEPGTPWLFLLDDLKIEDGAVEMEDAAGPFRSLLKPVAVHLQHFSTASNALAAVEVRLATESAETLQFKANGSLAPLWSAGNVQIGGLDLKKYQPYFRPVFRGVFADGKADVALEFSQSKTNDSLQAAISNASVRVKELQIQTPDGKETVVSIPSLSSESISADIADRSVRIGTVTSSGTIMNARRESDGSLNLLNLLAPPISQPAVLTNATAPPPAVSWHGSLAELSLQGWTLHLADHHVSGSAKLDLDQLALTLRGVQFPSNAPVAVQLAARVNGAGTIGLRGSIEPYSAKADADVQVAGLALKDFQPWIGQQVRLAIEQGSLNLTGHVQLAMAESAKPGGRFTGGVGILGLATVDQVLFKNFVLWDELAAHGIDLSWQPNRLSVEKVRFSGLKTSVIIDRAKRLNILAVLPATPTNAPPAVASTTNEFPFALGELSLAKTSIAFRDESIQPPCLFDLRQLDGTIRGISSRTDGTAEVSMSGRLDEASPFGVHGHFRPVAKALSLDLAFTNHNLQLTPFTTYLEKYAGHPLIKGRLSLDLNYAVEGQQLKAKNNLHLDQLTLGPRNQSPEATKLPVKLAVALLKDSNGRIDLDLPVEGRLDDPQFRIGPIILKVLVNLIAKSAASPFKLLGALVGGGEEMSFVDFQPGDAQLGSSQTNKLEKLVLALEKRPTLNLEIEGSADPAADRDALARKRVGDELKARRLKEIADIGQAAPSLESFQLEPAESERLLRAMVVQAGGTNLAALLHSVSERPSAATNASTQALHPLQDPSWVARVASLFKPRPVRAAIKQAHQAAKTDTLLREQNPELGNLTAVEMESLLAAKTDVPASDLLELMQERAKAVQTYLISSGKVSTDRLFLVTPKIPDGPVQGTAQVHLSLN